MQTPLLTLHLPPLIHPSGRTHSGEIPRAAGSLAAPTAPAQLCKLPPSTFFSHYFMHTKQSNVLGLLGTEGKGARHKSSWTARGQAVPSATPTTRQSQSSVPSVVTALVTALKGAWRFFPRWWTRHYCTLKYSIKQYYSPRRILSMPFFAPCLATLLKV